MRPVRTARSNFVWVGPDETIGDLHAYVERGESGVPQTETVWQLDPEERARVAAGANISLRVMGLHPPVILAVTDEKGEGEDAPEYRERMLAWRKEIGG